MLAFLKTRRAACVVAFATFALAVAGLGEAVAKSKNKKIIASVAPAVALTPSMSAQPPARFFTINQVLAKYDGHLKGADPVRLAAIQPSQSMTDAAVGPLSPQSTMSDEPFGLRAFRAPEGLLWIKWRKAEADIKADLETLQECRDNFEQCPATAARFALIIDEIKARSGRARIEAVNRLINSSVRYVSDLAQHGVLDRWTAPLATLAAGQGDCEVYAIAKYVALREAGVEADDLRLLVVRDRLAGGHAVLGVRHDGRWLILDNRHLALNEAAGLPHFTPLFAINHQGVKLFAAPYAAAAPAASHGLLISEAGAGTSGWNVAPLLL